MAPRRRIPKHLAILFVTGAGVDPETVEDRVLDSLDSLIVWCRAIGIEKLSLYDSDGMMLSRGQKISERLGIYDPVVYETSDSDIEYPLTPPASDYSESRPLSPEAGVHNENTFMSIRLADQHDQNGRRDNLRRRRQPGTPPAPKPLTLYLLSKRSSKPALALAARSFALMHGSNEQEQFSLSVETLNSHLEGNKAYPSPDFMIVYPLTPSTYHRAPLELYGFPPWQLRLTEIHLNRYRRRHRTWLTQLFSSWAGSPKPHYPLTELEFREALDEYAGAEMRFGK